MDDEQAEPTPGAGSPGAGESAPPPPPPPPLTPPPPPPPPPMTTTGWVLPANVGRPAINIGSIIGRTFDTFGREWSLFLVLAVPAALGSFVQGLVTPASAASPEAMPTLGEVVPYLATSVLAGLVGLVSTVMVAVAADGLWRGRQVGVAEAVTGGLRRLPRYFAVTVLIALAIGAVAALLGVVLVAAVSVGLQSGAVVLAALAAVVLLPVALWVAARLSLLGPVVVLEDHGIRGSITRAWDLSRGHAVMLFLLTFAIGVCAGLPLWGGSLFATYVESPWIAGLALAIAALVFQPLPVIAVVLAWGDLTGGRYADSPVMARGRGRRIAALLVFGLGAILFVAGFGVAGQYLATLPAAP